MKTKSKLLIFYSLIVSLITFLRFSASESSIKDSNIRLLEHGSIPLCSGINLNKNPSMNNYQNIQNMLAMYGDGEKKLVNAINDGDKVVYIKYLIPTSIPWIFLSLVSLLILIIFSCISCFTRCGCCAKKINLSNSTMRVYSAILAFFAFSSVILVIAGLIMVQDINYGGQATICASMTMLDEVMSGKEISKDQVWMGIDELDHQLITVIDNVNLAGQSLFKSFKDSQWLDSSIETLNTLNSKIFENNKGKQLESPDPSQPTVTISSLFIENSLGPPSNTSTLTGQLSANISLYGEAFLKTLSLAKNASESIISSTAKISADLSQGSKQLIELHDSFWKSKASINDDSEKINKIVQMISLALYIFLALYLIGPVLVLGNEGIAYFLKIPTQTGFLKIAWVWLLIFSFVGFLLAAVISPVSIVIFNSCGISKKFFSDQAFFNSLKIQEEIKERVEVCLFGDGNILKEFQIDAVFNGYAELSSQLDQIFKDTTSSNSSSFSNVDNAAKAASLLIQSYIDALNVVPDSNLNTELNPSISLSAFNSWTNYEPNSSFQRTKGQCQISQDEWVFALLKCNSNTKWNSTQSSNFGIGTPICLGIKDFSAKSVSERYLATGSCQGGVNTQIEKYYTSLEKYDKSRRKVFGDVNIDVGNFRTQLEQTINSSDELVSSLKTFQGGIDVIMNTTMANPGGIIYSCNCLFLSESANSLITTSCVEFLVPLYILTIFIISVSFASLLMAILSFLKVRNVKRMLEEKIEDWKEESIHGFQMEIS